MILTINNRQAVTLVLHMAIMRPSFNKLLKKQFKTQREHYLTSYDYIKDEAVYLLENKLDSYQVHMNVLDVKVLTEFLKAYTDKTTETIKQAEKLPNKKVADEDKAQIAELRDLQKECEELLQHVS